MKLTTRLIQFTLSAFLATGLASLASAASHAPNFIIMYIDDLGWADTSVPMMDSEPESKSDFYQTPHLRHWLRVVCAFKCLCARADLHTIAQEYSIRQDAWPSPIHFRA